jgi:hypothetical protein
MGMTKILLLIPSFPRFRGSRVLCLEASTLDLKVPGSLQRNTIKWFSAAKPRNPVPEATSTEAKKKPLQRSPNKWMSRESDTWLRRWGGHFNGGKTLEKKLTHSCTFVFFRCRVLLLSISCVVSIPHTECPCGRPSLLCPVCQFFYKFGQQVLQ